MILATKIFTINMNTWNNAYLQMDF